MSQLLKDKNSNDASPADDILSEFKPWTELGRRLASKRAAIIESGIPLLDDKELTREIAERRGGVTTANRRNDKVRTFTDSGVLITAARGLGPKALKALSILDDPDREFVSSFLCAARSHSKSFLFQA
jgi:hypothetical protein